MTRLLLCAGERSGDLLAASLFRELRRRDPGIVARGLVGPEMARAGVDRVAGIERLGAVGLVEAAGAAVRLKGTLDLLEGVARSWRPDVVVTVDSPSALLRLGPRVRALGLPALHWVSPQVWAWRPGRVARVGSAVDTLLCLFPFEPELYAGTSVRAVFSGHPALARFERSAGQTRPGTPTVLLAPGSRASEVEQLWPVFREVIALLKHDHPDLGVVVPVAPAIDPGALAGIEAHHVADMGAAAAVADVALVASGTATLELAALGVPMVVAYKVHPITWAIGRRLVRGVRHVALPNVLAGRQVVPEHLQDLDPAAIARDVAGLLGPAGQAQRDAVRPLLGSLGGADAVRIAADEVLRLVRTGSRTGGTAG